LAVSAARTAYRLLITLFVLGVVGQFYLAGAGVFRAHGPGKAVGSSTFDPHRALGNVLIILSVLVLLAALAARNGRWRFALALVVLMVVALFVAHASSWGGAFHPVIGLLIFGLSGWMADAVWRAHRVAGPSAP
jgi:NAD/NADP transhydrogenase beta subunit